MLPNINREPNNVCNWLNYTKITSRLKEVIKSFYFTYETISDIAPHPPTYHII